MNTINIPNGVEATIAVYRDHKLPEYNANPMIQALPELMTEVVPIKFIKQFKLKVVKLSKIM